MKFQLSPRHWLTICKIIGFCLLFIYSTSAGDQMGFFFILLLLALFILRQRVEKAAFTIYFDCIFCIFMIINWEYAPYALLLVLFEVFAKKKYLALLTIPYLIGTPEIFLSIFTTSLAGHFLGNWIQTKENDLRQRFELKSQVYELENLTQDLSSTAIEDARMATVAERARISREIHDNAGHDLIAAYISFQTLRNLIEDEETQEMYDATLERLSNGVGKIRDILHNIMPTETPGIAQLEKICTEFPLEIKFKAFGDATLIQTYIWNALALCLKESLTNISRHATATSIKVEIDIGSQIIRLYIENNGATTSHSPTGRGLTNLRYRIQAVGGNLSTNKENGIFKLICVIPIGKERKTYDKNTLSR